MSTEALEQSLATSQQTRYWNEMTQLKAHIFYLSYHCRRADRVDFWIKCVTAVASSSSIAGWVIWQSYGFVWALIIAVSQVITATKQYLPYESRSKETNDASKDLENLFIRAESDWYYVAEGSLSDEDIHKKMIVLKKGKADIVRKRMASRMLPRNDTYELNAAKDTEVYFQTLYFDGENNG